MDSSAQQQQQQQQPPQQPKPPGPGLFQCTTCRRTFTRIDHLARHVRSHLQERPFRCQECGKAYGRQDLLKRHAASHDGGNGGDRRRRQHTQSWRVSQACKPCAAAKLKCDDEKPCGRCKEKGTPCEAEGRQQVRQALSDASHVSSSMASTTLPSSSAAGQSQPQPQPQLADPSISVEETAPVDAMEKLPTPDTAEDGHVSPQVNMPDAPAFEFAEQDISSFPSGILTPLLSNPSRHCAPAASPDLNLGFGIGGLMDFTFDGGFDFDDTDLGFIDQLCNYPQAPDAHHLMQLPRQVPQGVGSGRPQGHVALGAEAYKRSSFSVWHPAQQDHGGAEVENLSVMTAADGSPQTQIVITERCLGENLNRAARDELLSMILRSCKPERLHYVYKAFPTPEFLDDLLQSFFSHHYRRVDSFIHIPSFQPNKQKPEFLGAIASAGATLTNIKSVHKLGFALQDAVRTTIPGRCEESNAITRDLWLLQAFMTELEVGIWSGIKRKMEIAESHSQTVFTMLRRAGRFKRLTQISSGPLPQDTGDTLHRKWLEWVEQESFKRLAFHAFLLDAQISMALLTNPIISYAELAIPLPDPPELWHAEDAQQWKNLYLNRSRPPPQEELSLIHFLHEPIEVPSHYDTHFSRLIILHGVWGMVWQHSQLLLAVGRPGQANAALALRHQSLLQMLQHFRINLSASHEPPCPQTSLLLELLPMYLHSSLEEIQLFAGREDLDDARRVLPSLQRWVESAESRQAIWHAGQVLRATRSFRPGQLRDFATIAIYHATLVMWTYSIISQAMGGASASQPKQAPTTASAAQRPVSLDGPNSIAIQHFITVGKGVPTITCTHHGGDTAPAAELVPLSDQEAVIRAVLDTLKGNFPCTLEEQAPPPLVENLIQLLRDLGKAAGRSWEAESAV